MVILATLALLLAVVGLTAAQEGVFESAGPGVDVSEPAVPQNTAPERTSPKTAATEEIKPTDEELPAAEESCKPVGKAKGSDKAGKGGQGGEVGRRKVTFCHKGKKTLTVGARRGRPPATRRRTRGVRRRRRRRPGGDVGDPGGVGQWPAGGAGRPGG